MRKGRPARSASSRRAASCWSGSLQAPAPLPANLPYGVVSAEAGSLAYQAIVSAIDLARAGTVAGIVTAQGGATAHSAIVARALGIPALVGAGAAVLLLAPMLPIIGRTINGARLWVGIGPLTFQPGELAKIALTIFFAGYLVTRRESLSIVGRKVLGVRIPRARELGPINANWAASLGVFVLQRDLGTSLLYFGIFLVMVYVATGRAIYVTVGLGMFITGALVAGRLMGYVAGRFDSWLDPFSPENYDAIGGSYQLVQGIFGLAHGGLLGTGLGGGVPQLVPLAESDFIIASLGEELGLIGLFAILALYLLLVTRGIRIGFNHPDDFSKLLAVGLSFVIALQTFIVIGGVTRVVPLTGLTTPLLAAGGSSLLANWIIIGLLLRISDSARSRGELQ